MARKLPPFAALRAFEALARRRNLAAAAEELLISPSAVSHQVKALEVFVGAKMFLRGPGGMTLTEQGQALFEGLKEGLDRIETATMRVVGERAMGVLTVHLYHSLAQLWLIPQLGDFLASNPGLLVKCVTKPAEADFAASTLDAAIRFADTPPAEALSLKLIDEVAHPVVSPGYLRGAGTLETPRDLIGKRLIGCEHQMREWRFWFDAVGLKDEPAEPHLVFDTRNQALQAAAEGLGVALNRRPSGELMISRGALLPLFGEPVATGGAYYFLAPARSASLPRVGRFAAWLASVTAHWRGAASER